MEETNTPASEESAANTETGTPQESLVRVEDASEADLDAFLAKQPTESPEPEEEIKPKTPEPGPDGEEKAEPPKEEPQQQLTPEAHEQEKQRLREQIERQRVFINRRSNEIGDLRKQLREARDGLAHGLDERFLENPSQAVDDKAAIREIDQHLENLHAEESQMLYQHQAQQVILNYVEPERIDMDAMVNSLRDDGFDDNFIRGFVQNPVQSCLPETFVQLSKRSEAEKAARILAKGYKELKARNQELEGKLKAAPQEVLSKMNKALKAPAPMTAANGSSSAKEVTPNMNPALMSDAELDAWYDKLSQRR